MNGVSLSPLAVAQLEQQADAGAVRMAVVYHIIVAIDALRGATLPGQLRPSFHVNVTRDVAEHVYEMLDSTGLCAKECKQMDGAVDLLWSGDLNGVGIILAVRQ